MFKQSVLIGRTAAGAILALAVTVAPASAASWGVSIGGYGGGYGGYGGNSGYRGGNEGYRGGYSGYNGAEGYRGAYNGYNGAEGYRGGYGGYNLGYYSSYGNYPNRGYGYYPSYNYGSSAYSSYYSTPSVQITIPTYVPTQAAYAEPAQPDNSARVEVMVPAGDVQVFIDGNATRQTGTDRLFACPPLEPGKTYHYDIEARWLENGRQVNQTRTVPITAGQTATVDFTR